MTEPMPNQARHVHRLCIALYDDLLAAAKVIAEHFKEKKGNHQVEYAYAFDKHIKESIKAIDKAIKNARTLYREDCILPVGDFEAAKTTHEELDAACRLDYVWDIIDAAYYPYETEHAADAESSVSELQRLRDAAVKRLG